VVDEEKVNAKYENGILKLSIPKKKVQNKKQPGKLKYPDKHL
jgi:HSP20 family molecular chaperone IbpA